MALKTTQRELKRKFREEIKNLKWAIYAECFGCMSFQGDGYYDCGIKTCPLYDYRLRRHLSRCSKELGSFLRDSKRRTQQKKEVDNNE